MYEYVQVIDGAQYSCDLPFVQLEWYLLIMLHGNELYVVVCQHACVSVCECVRVRTYVCVRTCVYVRPSLRKPSIWDFFVKVEFYV